ncbi:MAG: hypothetical protein ACTHWZ_03615 [Peptoniphilaceae bacterium]
MTLGNLFGRVKFGKFSFGITGTLFVGLFLGYLLTRYSVNLLEVLGPDDKLSSRLIAVTEGQIIDKSLMQLSLLIFIIGTGLLAAKDMKYTISKYGKQFVALAIIIPLTGALTSYGCSKFFNGISPFEATGTYTGSLTSSAGLAAAVESSEVESREIAMEFPNMADESKQKVLNMINHGKKVEAELKGKEFSNELTLENTKEISPKDTEIFINEAKTGVGVGHSIGYPFGVLFLILAVNFIPAIFKFDVEEEKRLYFAQKTKDMENMDMNNNIKEVKMDFAAFSIVAFLGYALGSLKIYLGPLGYFSLGSIGGSIIVSLILGSIGKVGPLTFRMDSTVLGKLRTYFLSLFLAGTGLNFGYKVVQAVIGNGIVIALISIIVSILVGFLVGRYLFKVNWTVLSGAITGGMTSAPGLGAAIDAVGCDEPATSYGATQPLATLFMVIFSIIIHKLPI